MMGNPEYKSAWVCVNCKEQLSYSEKMHSKGVCPYCGNMSGCTIVDTEQRAIKEAV